MPPPWTCAIVNSGFANLGAMSIPSGVGLLHRQVVWQGSSSPELEGRTFMPPPRSTQIRWSDSGFKSAIVEQLKAYANSSQFLDVGANLGQTMLEMWSLNQDVEYFGFEPNPQAFACLQDLARSIQIKAELYPWACGASSSPASFFASSIEDCSATLLPQIRPNTYPSQPPTHVATYPLDQSPGIDRLSPCFVMKIDVEGFENEVLRGSEKTIRNKRPFILCEVLHAHRESEIGLNNARKSQLKFWLDKNGYRIMEVNLSREDRNTYLGLTEIGDFRKNVLWKDSPHSCDFLFVPIESEFGR